MNISVIIPIKNRAHLIGETLESIFSQTLPPSEVIVVDDGSEDDLVKGLGEYVSKVKLIKSDGSGPGAARNTGFRASCGKYIQFFDSDDLMSLNKLEVQSFALSNSKSQVAYGPYVVARKNDNSKWEQLDVIMQEKPLPSVNSFLDYTLRGWCSITQATLFKRKLLNQIGPWREDISTHEDLDFWIRVAQLEANPIHTPESLVVYRRHDHQLTSDSNKAKYSSNNLSVLKSYTDLFNNTAVSFQTKFIMKSRILHLESFIDKSDLLAQRQIFSRLDRDFIIYINRLRNKFERLFTNSNWERMHGISKTRMIDDWSFK